MMTPLRLAAALLLVATAGCDAASTAAPGPAGTGAGGAAKAAAAAKTDWLAVTVATPDGGFRLGNPQARVKLVEFASLTCPHCKDFHAEAFEKIKRQYVASGNVSYEFRNFVLNGPDFAASLLARCQGAGPFFGLLNSFYSDQASWIAPFTTLTPADQARLQALPADKQLAELGTLGKLDVYVRARGIPKARFDACLVDKGALAALETMRKQATETYKLTGTPGFVINGTTQDGVFTWAQLEPKLQAALR